jgi:perosamine synthetase
MIPVNTPDLSGNEKQYLLECITTGWISSEGPFVERFEKGFAEVVQRHHGIACCNGSAALDLALAALGLQEGDEVIMPTFTIISPAASVVRAGATPVLVDCDPHTWNMDVHRIEGSITSRTKAIIVVHIYGLPVDMDPVVDIARQHGLSIVEDAAEMHGQSYRGKPCGSFGDISTFSFYPNKHITCGEGGMLVTDSQELADACRSFRNLCFESGRRFVHSRLGWNYRMTNLQAAVGVAQLERLPAHVRRKREIGRLYATLLADVTGVQLPLDRTEYAENIYWVFGLVLQRDDLHVDDVTRQLSERGIGTRPFFWPMHEQPVFRRIFAGQRFRHAETLGRRGFYLPSGLGLTDDDIRTVCASVREILRA